jgi:Glycosyl hydrolases family 16
MRGSCVLLAMGASLFAAACGSVASTTTAGNANFSTPVVEGTALSPIQPVVTSHATVSETPTGPSGTTTSHAAQPTATATKPSRAANVKPSIGAGGTSSSQANLDPSGEEPSAALSGFSLQYVQDFNGNSLPAGWDAFSGVPGGESADVAQWEPSMCTFSNGEAHFMADGIDSCGLEYYADSQEYGAWFARLKGDSEPSDMTFSDIFLLWPYNNQWPPEIDIYEDMGRDRSSTRASMFNTVGSLCGSSPTPDCLLPYTQSNGGTGGVPNGGTEWHTYGVEWTPSGVTWLIDGKVIFTAPASEVKSPAQQPAMPMDFGLQSQNLQGAGTPTLRETMTVDWVEQYSWNG